MKSRFAILRSHAFYPIEDQNKIIMACCMIHNFIRTTNPHDPEEENVNEDHCDGADAQPIDDFVGTVEASVEWTGWRDTMAHHMYNEWLGVHQ